jgi:hypothetical protein
MRGDASLAQQFTSGACHCFLRFGGSNAEYLGTSERGARVRWRRSYTDVWNDIGGQGVPFDKLYEGGDALVFFDLNRWNQVTLAKLEIVPNSQTGVFGLTADGDIGTLMGLEGKMFELSLQFPYSTLKPAMSTQPRGLRFPNGILQDESWDPLGTNARRVPITFYCFRSYDPITRKFLLCDTFPSTTVID